jgi:hypothetical protein
MGMRDPLACASGFPFFDRLEIRVNKITWDKIGGVTEPGRYRCFFGYLNVTSEDIEVWVRYPQATFTLISRPTSERSVGEDYRLGAFDVGDFQE